MDRLSSSLFAFVLICQIEEPTAATAGDDSRGAWILLLLVHPGFAFSRCYLYSHLAAQCIGRRLGCLYKQTKRTATKREYATRVARRNALLNPPEMSPRPPFDLKRLSVKLSEKWRSDFTAPRIFSPPPPHSYAEQRTLGFVWQA